jgi:type IV secretion system protein VirD4
MLAGLWCATQWTAALLRYAPQLGPAWWHVGWWSLYLPWQYVGWFLRYSTAWPGVFARTRLAVLAGVAVGLACAGLGRWWQRGQEQAPTTFGSSRWATWQDIRRSGLLSGDGVMLGQVRGRYLRHGGPEHLLVFAPTRSGKGTGLVIPTLLSVGGSVLVHDIKGENWELTAGWRARFSHVIYFNPTSPQSARYNPLLEIRKGDDEVRDAQNVADILVDPEGANDRRDHWAKTGHALLVGAILHVLYAEPDKTLSGVATFLADPQRSFTDTLDVMMRTLHLGNAVHPVVASAARELLNKSPNELSGVLSTAMSFLGVYRDPIVARTTSTSDFRLADLQHAASPVSLYLVVPPSDLSRTKPLMRLVLNQVGRMLTEDLHAPRQHPLLLLLDEFPALGRLDFFESALAFIAGYGIKAFLIAQSLNQLDKAYGQNNAILDNCHVRIAFAANDDRTAKRVSDLLGMATELRQQASFGGKRWSLLYDRRLVSSQEAGRPLLTPGEVMQLDAEAELILVAGHPPMRAQKLRYFRDPVFRARVVPAPALGTPDVPARAPSPWETEGPKARLPGRTRAQPRAADEEMDEEGPVLDHTGSEEHDASDEEDAIEEGHVL